MVNPAEHALDFSTALISGDLNFQSDSNSKAGDNGMENSAQWLESSEEFESTIQSFSTSQAL